MTSRAGALPSDDGLQPSSLFDPAGRSGAQLPREPIRPPARRPTGEPFREQARHPVLEPELRSFRGRTAPSEQRVPMAPVPARGRRRTAIWAVAVVVVVAAGAGVAAVGRRHGSAAGPALPADYVAVGTDACTSGRLIAVDRTRASLAGPHFAASFDRAGTCTTTPRGGPAAGHELLVLGRSTTDEATGGDFGDGAGQVRFAISLDGRTAQLPQVPLPSHDVVVSVPTGHDAFLTVSDAGRAQSLSLRNATRGPDAVQGYYTRGEVTVHGDRSAQTGIFAVRGGPTRYAFTLGVDTSRTRAALRPWEPVQGWAAPGRAWLFLDDIQVSVTTPRPAGMTRPDVVPGAAAPGQAATGPPVLPRFEFVAIGSPRPQPAAQVRSTVEHGTALVFDVPLATRGGRLVARLPEVLRPGRATAVHAGAAFRAVVVPVTVAARS